MIEMLSVLMVVRILTISFAMNSSFRYLSGYYEEKDDVKKSGKPEERVARKPGKK